MAGRTHSASVLVAEAESRAQRLTGSSAALVPGTRLARDAPSACRELDAGAQCGQLA
jgi:hypothetical protein